MGNTPIDIRDNNIIIGEKEYEGTPGLWELIISKKPDNNIYTWMISKTILRFWLTPAH